MKEILLNAANKAQEQGYKISLNYTIVLQHVKIVSCRKDTKLINFNIDSR